VRTTCSPGAEWFELDRFGTTLAIRETMLSTRVLVVDGDILVARAIGRALLGSHDVAIEIDPLCARHRLANERFDVVLCDDRTAASHFLDALESRPQLVVMSSAELEAGESDGFLRKPFEANEMLALIDRLIAKSSP
jgi:DNA-binding NtrC family response regulator